jgi:hypothetical protein
LAPQSELDYKPNNQAAFEMMAEFGTYLAYFDGHPGRSEQETVREWIEQVGRLGSPNAVYMDTTTIHTALTLLKGQHVPAPTTLFDLANVISSLVLSDTIYFLENPHIDPFDFNEYLGLATDPPFIQIPVQSANNAVGSLLRGIWLHSMEYVERLGANSPGLAEDATQVKSAWEELLGTDIDWEKWGESARTFTSRAYGEISVPRDIFAAATDLFRYDASRPYRPEEVERKRVSDFILECNNRSLFNFAVGSVLHVQYIPNAFRLPFHQFLYRRGHASRQYFIRWANDKFRRSIADQLSVRTGMELPLFMSAIFERASSLSEVKEMICDFRERAISFRRRRAELNQVIRDGNQVDAKKLARAIEGEEGPKLWKWCAASTAVFTVAAAGAALESFHPGALHALENADPLVLKKIFEIAAEVTVVPAIGTGVETLPHLFRPRMRFLARTAEAARGLGEARAKISELWRMERPLGDDYAEALNRVARLDY